MENSCGQYLRLSLWGFSDGLNVQVLSFHLPWHFGLVFCCLRNSSALFWVHSLGYQRGKSLQICYIYLFRVWGCGMHMNMSGVLLCTSGVRGSLYGSVLSFHHVGPGDGTQPGLVTNASTHWAISLAQQSKSYQIIIFVGKFHFLFCFLRHNFFEWLYFEKELLV